MKKLLILFLISLPIFAMEKTKKTHTEIYEREVKVLELSFLKSMQKQYEDSMPYDDKKELEAYLLLQANKLFQQHRERLSDQEKMLLSSTAYQSKVSDLWKRRRVEQPQMTNLKKEKKLTQTELKPSNEKEVESFLT